MRWYTEKHVWLEEKDDGTMDVGITSQGDDLMGGIQYAAVEDGKLVVESTKAYEVLDLPVKGLLHEKTVQSPVPAMHSGWDEELSIGWFESGYDIDREKVMDRKAYLEMCFGASSQ